MNTLNPTPSCLRALVLMTVIVLQMYKASFFKNYFMEEKFCNGSMKTSSIDNNYSSQCWLLHTENKYYVTASGQLA